MSLLKKIITYLKKFLKKEKDIKMIPAPSVDYKENSKEEFINTIRINTIIEKNNKEIETLVCVGDGLGIQGDLKY